MARQLKALVLLAAMEAVSSAPKSSTSWMRSMGKCWSNRLWNTARRAAAWSRWATRLPAWGWPSKPQ